MSTFSVRIPDDLHETLRRFAFENRTSLQAITTQALRAYLEPKADSDSMSAQERRAVNLLLDLLRNGPEDLRRLQEHLLEYWSEVRTGGEPTTVSGRRKGRGGKATR